MKPYQKRVANFCGIGEKNFEVFLIFLSKEEESEKKKGIRYIFL